MDAVLQSLLNGLPYVLLHVGISVGLLIIAVTIYTWMTPWEDIALVREGNTAAGVALAGMIVAMAIPLAFSMKASQHWLDILVWGLVSLILLIITFFVIDLLLRGLPAKIREGSVGPAVVLAGAKIAVATIIAAAVSG